MSAIYPATIPVPATNGLSRTTRTKDPAAVLPVLVGEVPEARAGERTDPANTLYNGYLKIFRGNPEALMEIFQKGREIFNQRSVNELLPETAKNVLGQVAKIIDSLLCSPKSLANPLFLKDYAAKLGLSLEGTWFAFVRQGRGNQHPAESLKSLLLKLAGELKGLLKANESRVPEELQKLTHLAKLTEESLRAIETQQMINIHSQENESNYLLQIPLLFPEGVRTGEIFIGEGKNGTGGEGNKNKFHVVMFLSMDRLGDMVVDASLNDHKIACVFKFTDPEAKVFFSPYLAGLGEALRKIGYGCDSLATMVTEDLPVVRQDCRREMFFEQDAINMFV